MAAVWSDQARFEGWLRIEVLACEAWGRLGRIPQEDVRAITERASFTIGRVEELERVTKRLALSHRDTVIVGRTHGVHAEPTSFGHKIALWAFQMDRDRDRLRRVRELASVGKLSGVVGTYAQVDPRVEEEVCAALGLRPAEASSQVIPRDRHAEFAAALGLVASSLDLFATELRHLARTEVR